MIRHKFLRMLIVAMLAVIAPMVARADDSTIVQGTATYFGEPSDSRIYCERQALEMARVEALGREFGWTVEGVTYQQETVTDKGENLYFDSTSGRHVNGEWLADIEVSYDYDHSDTKDYIVTCTVKGRARRAHNEVTAFEATVLRNGTTASYADTDFNVGDNLFLLFRAPADGYVSVYVVDDRQRVFSVLPYVTDEAPAIEVKRNRDYVFFSDEVYDSSHGIPDVLVMTADSDVERDEVVVVYSPEKFNRAADVYVDDNTPRMLDLRRFNRWLERARRNDRRMSVTRIPITIHSTNNFNK